MPQRLGSDGTVDVMSKEAWAAGVSLAGGWIQSLFACVWKNDWQINLAQTDGRLLALNWLRIGMLNVEEEFGVDMKWLTLSGISKHDCVLCKWALFLTSNDESIHKVVYNKYINNIAYSTNIKN